MPAKAAWICPVGSSVENRARSRRRCLADRSPAAAQQQQPAVGPAVVAGPTAVPVDLLGDALPDLGEHQVRQPVQVPVVHHERRVRQHPAKHRGERCGRVDRDDFDPSPELRGLQPEPAANARAGPARRQSPDATRVSRVEVDEARHPGIGAAPARLGEQPPDRPGPGLIDAEHPQPHTAPDRSRRRPWAGCRGRPVRNAAGFYR